jgi:membrane-associated phospholipid phosphatase
LTTGPSGSAGQARPLAPPHALETPSITRRGLTLAAQNVGRAALLFAAVVALGVSRISLPIYVYVGIVGGALAAIYLAERDTNVRWWATYVLGFVLFALLRALADETGVPWQFDYVIAIERVVGLGTVPTVWLQQHFYTPGAISNLDYLLYAVYISYFFVPHLAAVLIWRANRDRFRLFVIAMLGTFYVGLLASFVLPTAPPWLAGENGYLPYVFKVKEHIVYGVDAQTYQAGYTLVAGNPVAAMPSLHMAITALVAFFMWRHSTLAGVTGALYAAAMGFALVYLGEHYVADVLAGVLVAAIVWRVANRTQRRMVGGPADGEGTLARRVQRRA